MFAKKNVTLAHLNAEHFIHQCRRISLFLLGNSMPIAKQFIKSFNGTVVSLNDTVIPLNGTTVPLNDLENFS
ncbi:MAG: hypothetical protein K6E54_05280 [Bacteroidaceae bacterium]|nr:hypothetical protein [Bacteroidaceae bacterium]